MVPNVEAALEAASWNVDVVVAQGIEAGGHGYHEALPLLSLLPLVSRGFSKLEAPPVLIGAGGLVNGSQLAAILPFADGAVMGTRFLACPEALYSDEQKQLLVRTTRTKRTTVFDYCRSTEGFPVGVNGRAIENETTAEADISGVTEALRLKYLDAVKVKDVKRIVTWSVSLTCSTSSSSSITNSDCPCSRAE
jgi:nitronate monooxygenase